VNNFFQEGEAPTIREKIQIGDGLRSGGGFREKEKKKMVGSLRKNESTIGPHKFKCKKNLVLKQIR